MSGKVFGILRGYLPYEGVLEIEHYTGSISEFSFSPYLGEVLKANPSFFLHLLEKQVCLTFDDLEGVESIQENE